MMGSRTAINPNATAWAQEVGARGHAETFAEPIVGSDVELEGPLKVCR
jgi:hypothetical protein